MTEYGVMSDFEINKRVFAAVHGVKPLGYPHNADGRSVGNDCNGNYTWYDYCNDPDDAWAIIVKHRICISPVTGDDGIPRGWLAKIEGVPSRGDDKPLRAAMIVFLMKLDRS